MKILVYIIALLSITWSCKSKQAVVVDFAQEEIALQSGLDSLTGLKIGPNLMYVKAHCTSCHSAKMITMNRFTREGWQEKIRWMQLTQNLWDLGEAELLVLDYLEQNYSPEQQQARRKNLEGIVWYELD
jgi:hypothetical protein